MIPLDNESIVVERKIPTIAVPVFSNNEVVFVCVCHIDIYDGFIPVYSIVLCWFLYLSQIYYF